MKKEHVIVRRIDDLGRVVIPKGIRQKFNINEGDALRIEIDKRTGGFIMISKWVESEDNGCIENKEKETNSVLDMTDEEFYNSMMSVFKKDK